MCLKYQSLVFLATLFILNCDVTESGSLGSISSRPNEGLLNLILESRGTSVDQIENIILSAAGDVQQVVSAINSELQENVLGINGDTLRLSAEGLQNIVQSGLQALIQSKFSHNPALASTLEKNFLQQLNSTYAGWSAVIQQRVVPLEVAQQWLQNYNLNRSKRSLQAKDFDLASIIGGLVSSVLQDQLNNILVGILENVKTIVEGFYVSTASGNDIQDFFTGIVNWAVKTVLQLITAFEESLTSTSSTTETTSRRRRDVQDVVALEGSSETTAGSSEDESSSRDTGLDIIVRPVFTVLATILTPVSVVVKGIAGTVLTLLEPVVGTIIITRVRVLVVAIIDLIIPAN